jgi:hypothetical protein
MAQVFHSGARQVLIALASLAAMAGGSMAAELVPTNARSIRLAGLSGIVYYSVEQDGYRVVATLASSAGDLSFRFISTLAPGQRITLSVPQSVGRPPVDFDILRKDDTLVVSDAVMAAD